MAMRLSDADLLINQQSYGQSQCPLWSIFLRDRSWPVAEVQAGAANGWSRLETRRSGKKLDFGS